MNKKPTLEEIAQKGEAIKKKRSAAKLAKESKEKNELQNHLSYYNQKRVFAHISGWYALSTIIYVRVLYYCLLVFAIALSLLFTVSEVNFNVIWLVALVIVMLVLPFIGSYIGKRKIEKELDWLNNLPFELITYPDFFIYKSYPSVHFTINFKNKVPTEKFVLNLLATLPLETTKWEYGEVPFTLEVTYPKGSKFNLYRRWAYRWVHRAVDGPFKALHEEYPIKNITFYDGDTEFDFSWWEKRKKNKWWW